MIPLLLSVAFALGVYLVYDGLTDPKSGEPESGRAARPGAVEAFLRRAGLPDVSPREFLLFSVLSGLAIGVLAELALGWPVVSVLGGAIGAAGPLAYYVDRHDRRVSLLQVGIVESIEQLRDSIRAGLGVQESLAGLARTGPETLRPEFASLVRDIRLDGFEAALAALRERLADPLFDMVAIGLVLNDRLGGRNVSEVLDRLAHSVRAQLRVEEEIRAYQARNVLSARVVAAVPLVVLIGVRAVSPRYLAVYSDLSGQVILGLCVLSIAVGYVAMLALTRLPGDRRVFR